jgi:hypothetical protein
VIRNAVLHVQNEQPLLADLFGVPTAADAGLLCTNVRMMDGKRPIFIDSSAATFFFPYLVIRFLEIPPGALERHVAETGDASPMAARATDPAAAALPLDPDTRLPVAVGGPEEVPAEDDIELDIELDIDEGFLQRVRDI